MQKYSSIDKYEKRVVRAKIFQTSIPHTFVQLAQLWKDEAIHTGQGLVQPKYDKEKKRFTSRIEKYHINRKREAR